MNKLEKLIDDGIKVKIQSSSKFCLTIDNTTPSVSFNSDSIEDAIDLAYEFVEEQKKASYIVETEEQLMEIIIEEPQQEIKIDEDILNKEIITTTSIRIYSDVCERFKEFAEKNQEFKSVDLISMALIEYIEKYKEENNENKENKEENNKDKEDDKD